MATKKTPKNSMQSLVHETVNEFVDYIKCTYGPAENKVLIPNPYGGNHAVDDGVAIARAYQADDDAKNSIIRIIRDVAIRTNDLVGDGTTSSLIMLQAIMNEVEKNYTGKRQVISELRAGLEEFKIALRKKAKKITNKEELKRIAKISFNNEKIAEIISTLVFAIGPSGVINIDDAHNAGETTGERVLGLEIQSGYAHPAFVNNDKMECVLENPYILITDYRFTTQGSLIDIMNKVLEAKKKDLVIISDRVEGDAMSNLLVNNSTIYNPETKKTGALRMVSINLPPGNKEEFMQDLAVITGGEVFSIARGVDFANIELKQLGQCEKIVVTSDSAVVVGGKAKKDDIKTAISTLSAKINMSQGYEKEKLEKRLSKFTNGVAVIRLGAPTESELKALKLKVEDAVNATKAAFKGGVVCGGGLCLARTTTSSPILNKALKYPFGQLKENSEIAIELSDLKDNEAINAVTHEVGDYMKMGIIDPVEVLIAGVESAISIASTLISLKGNIYETTEDKRN